MKKTPTIFKRNSDNMKLVTSQINPVCQWVFDGEGIATRKYDGTCCMVRDEKLYKRRELKQGDNLPHDFELVDYDDETKKTLGWVPVDVDNPADKWHTLAFNSTLRDGTYELIGEKIQNNPEKIIGHKLLLHDFADEMYPPRSFDGLKEWIKDKDIEGLVFHHEDGRMAKIKKRDFGFNRIN